MLRQIQKCPTAYAMELRSGIYKGVHGVLPVQHRAQFEEGVNLLFSSWTALCLAIDHEWGGPSSRLKAEQLYQDVLYWFYGHTGALLVNSFRKGQLLSSFVCLIDIT